MLSKLYKKRDLYGRTLTSCQVALAFAKTALRYVLLRQINVKIKQTNVILKDKKLIF